MPNQLFCIKLNQMADAMKSPPFPGELGLKIHSQISQQAWAMWLSHQTMLINEYRLNLADSKSREFLLTEMQKYFFGEGSEKPTGFVAPDSISK
jgi:Fe-S cluster biosynthesis and repair protein YggX